MDKRGKIKLRVNSRTDALDKLAQHLDLLRPRIKVTERPTGPATVNYTQIYLDELTTEELEVLQRVRKVDKARWLADFYETAGTSLGLPVAEDTEAIRMFRLVLEDTCNSAGVANSSRRTSSTGAA